MYCSCSFPSNSLVSASHRIHYLHRRPSDPGTPDIFAAAYASAVVSGCACMRTSTVYNAWMKGLAGPTRSQLRQDLPRQRLRTSSPIARCCPERPLEVPFASSTYRQPTTTTSYQTVAIERTHACKRFKAQSVDHAEKNVPADGGLCVRNLWSCGRSARTIGTVTSWPRSVDPQPIGGFRRSGKCGRRSNLVRTISPI